MSNKIVFSGIQPSGNLHIGNYIGAVKHWAEGQTDGLNIFCLVDLHAITVPQDAKALHEKTLELAGPSGQKFVMDVTLENYVGLSVGVIGELEL